jgi:serine/threonine protein kinase
MVKKAIDLQTTGLKTRGQILNGRYEIQTVVGKGGLGTVYRGLDKTLERPVAVKEFCPSQAEGPDTQGLGDLERAFRREAILLANLKSERDSLPIPAVYDYFEEGEGLYLVMEFVEGDDLKKAVKDLKGRHGQLSEQTVRSWAKDLLNALSYLHDRESPIYHRDIKPDNLKIRDRRICLLDFGLAKGATENMSSVTTQSLYGFTARYAPIEQIRGEITTPRTDIYGLSATLYYLVTCEEPADARIREREIRESGIDPLIPIKELRPQVEGLFAAAIMKGLSAEAKERHKSARAMLKAFDRSVLKPVESNGDSGHNQDRNAGKIRVAIGIPSAGGPEPGPAPFTRDPVTLDARLPKKVLAGLAVLALCALVFVLVRWTAEIVPAPIASTTVDSGVQLLVDANLYSRPSLSADSHDSVRRGTYVRIQQERLQPSPRDTQNRQSKAQPSPPDVPNQQATPQSSPSESMWSRQAAAQSSPRDAQNQQAPPQSSAGDAQNQQVKPQPAARDVQNQLAKPQSSARDVWWFQIKTTDGAKEGWVRCATKEMCFSPR